MISSYKNNLSIDFSGWFVKLADLADKAEDSSALPKVDLVLHNSTVITGSIIGYDRTRSEKLLMVLRISPVDSKTEVTIVPVSYVIAITFLDANSTLVALENKTTISGLELRRRAIKTEEDIQKFTTRSINIVVDTDTYPENHRRYVYETLNLLPSIFEYLTKDEFGKQAVDENIDRIKILLDDESKITLLNKEVVIGISKSYKFPEKESERIKKEIESLL
jgi:hypothetical protein